MWGPTPTNHLFYYILAVHLARVGSGSSTTGSTVEPAICNVVLASRLVGCRVGSFLCLGVCYL